MAMPVSRLSRLVIVAVSLVGVALLPPIGPAGASARAGSKLAVTCPGNPVAVSVSMMANLQDYVSACPGGTEFDLPVGDFYRFGTIYPVTGDRFIGTGTGPGGTNLYGSRILPTSNWSAQSGVWVDSVDVTLDTRAIAALDDKTGVSCAVGYYPQGPKAPGICDYPDLLFLDGAWLARVLGPDPLAPCPGTLVTAGTYCIDYGAKKIFLGTDPAGHTVSYSGDSGAGQLLQFAFERTTITGLGGLKLAPAVTLMKLQVSQYANTDPTTAGVSPPGGAVVQMTNGWVLDNVVISMNHGVGLGMGGDAWTVSNTTLTYNGKSGYGGPSSNGTFGPNNSVTYNNQDFFNVVWGAGAGKMSGAGPITIFASTFSHNLGNGLWFDASYHNALVTGNTMVGNTGFPPGDSQHGGDGIRVEISCFITITNNVVTGNDRVGINLDNSHDVTVGGVGGANTVSGNGNGEIQVSYHGRTGSGFCSPLSSKNNHVINNAMTMSGTDAVGVQVDAACNGCVSGTLFTGNTYAGGFCSDLLWQWWDGSIQQKVDFPTWKASYGQDPTGWCEGSGVPPTINGLSPKSGTEQGG